MMRIDDPRDNSRPTGLYSKHETSELIRRLGLQHGFSVISEYPVKVPGRSAVCRIDWVWRKDDGIVIAFEVEAVNANKASLERDHQKFVAGRIATALVVLYDARYVNGSWRSLNLSKAVQAARNDNQSHPLVFTSDLQSWISLNLINQLGKLK